MSPEPSSGSKVKSFKNRVTETTFKSRYERVERVESMSPAIKAPPAAAGKLSGLHVRLREESPIPGWILIQNYDDDQLFERPNALLLFSVLKGFFGDADLLGAAVAEDESGELSLIPLTADWGFLFHLAPDLASGVRSLDGDRRIVVRF